VRRFSLALALLTTLTAPACGGDDDDTAPPSEDAGPGDLDAAADAARDREPDAPAPLPEAETCEIGPPALYDWHLAADGRVLRDALGRAVLLRGVNAGGRSKFAPFLPFAWEPGDDFDAAAADYFDRVSAWGFDAVRLVFTWEAIEPEPGQDDETHVARYVALIDAAWARGIRVIVDFHQDVYASIYCGDGFPLWTLPDELLQETPEDCSDWFAGYLRDPGVRAAFDRFWADTDGVQGAYVALWDRMVERTKDRPGVIGFEPINEPGWGTAVMEDWEREVLAPFFARMAERMRAAAPEALVFVDATGLDALSATTALPDPDVPGLVFAPHFYEVNTVIFERYDAGTLVRDALGRWDGVGAAWDVPVVLGEFGVSHRVEGAVDYVRDHLDALDELGMGGLYWEYSLSNERWSQEDMALVEGDGTERPAIVDGLVRPYLRATAGVVVAAHWELAARTLRATVEAEAGGITEVALPDRVYPDGVAIGATGACVEVDEDARVIRVRSDAGGPVELELRPR
jgi:endoglycosylceramidase